MQAVFHNRAVFRWLLHAAVSTLTRAQRQQDEVSLWMRRKRLVLSADKTDVEQCLPHIETLTEINRYQEVASSPTSLWPRWPAPLFFADEGRVRHVGATVSRVTGTVLKALRQFSFFS